MRLWKYIGVWWKMWSCSVQSLSRVSLFATPWTAARQASLSITNSRSLLKLMSIELVMPSNHLILCRPLLLLLSVFPSIRVFFLLVLISIGSDEVTGVLWRRWRSLKFAGSSRVGRKGWRCCGQSGTLKCKWKTLEGVCWESSGDIRVT